MDVIQKKSSLLAIFNRWRESKLETLVTKSLHWYSQQSPENYLIFQKNWLHQGFLNLPNALSLFRLAAIFPLLGLISLQDKIGYWPALTFFGLITFTDMLDGTIARVSNCQTKWGCFIDSLADKLLAVLLITVQNHHHPILVVELIWATALGEILYCAMKLLQLIIKFKPYSLNSLGKIKFFLQVVVVIILLIKAPWALSANLILICSLIMLYSNIATVLWLILTRHRVKQKTITP